MKIQLLIAISDDDYAEHLSQVLIEKKPDVFDISLCSSPEHLSALLTQQRIEVALLDHDMVEEAELSRIKLPIYLWDGITESGERARQLPKIRQYQRISSMVGEIVEQYASVRGPKERFGDKRARITAVWSPAGGSGKTTVALAYAAKRASEGMRAAYLDLEPFSATSAYFKEPGKSISTVFEKLDGDVALMFQSIQMEDSGSGIIYFGCPRNYDDINILTEDDITVLLEGCAVNYDELVVDLGSHSSGTVRRVLEAADQVFLVSDSSSVCRAKCDQFRTQHNLYAELREKLVVVANRGARGVAVQDEQCISLPRVETDQAAAVYKTLAQYLQ